MSAFDHHKPNSMAGSSHTGEYDRFYLKGGVEFGMTILSPVDPTDLSDPTNPTFSSLFANRDSKTSKTTFLRRQNKPINLVQQQQILIKDTQQNGTQH
eukprot:scaffold2322_cov135-Cylindrotheca_fusiformis.AAC.9